MGNRTGALRERSGREATWHVTSRIVLWSGSVLLGALLVLCLTASLRAQDVSERLEARFLTLIRDQGLDPDQVALLVLSSRYRSVLVQHRATEPMPAASNAKILTAYAALRALTPNFRWRTRVFRVADHDGAADTGRQGLLIEAAGDPTLSYADLEDIARRLRAAGIRSLSGGLYLDGTLFGPAGEDRSKGIVELEPTDLPDAGADDSVPLTAPTAFVVEHNAPELLVYYPDDGTPDALSGLPADALRIVAKLQPRATGRTVLRVDQTWDDKQGTVTLTGTVSPGLHTLKVPVEQSVLFFAGLLRSALHRQGIEGALPLRPVPQAGVPRDLLLSHYSPPLREVIGPVLRDSDNLAADTLLWTLAAQARPGSRSGPLDLEDGLRWERRLLQADFPGILNELELSDGSGLTGQSRVTARALVRVLHGAMIRSDFGPEFVSSLSRAAWDGTLHYRTYPAALEGRLRAKTGTLTGVANLTGVLPLVRDELVFSFLIAQSGMSRDRLQGAQDRVMASLYELFRKQEILGTDTDPLAPKPLVPPPPSFKQGRRKSLKPPAASPKPKAGGSNEPSGVGQERDEVKPQMTQIAQIERKMRKPIQ